jgi:hypothetical protein
VRLLEQLREQFELVIKGCACSIGCKLCDINRAEAMKGLQQIADFGKLFELAVVCRRCGALADPENHVCGCQACD